MRIFLIQLKTKWKIKNLKINIKERFLKSAVFLKYKNLNFFYVSNTVNLLHNDFNILYYITIVDLCYIVCMVYILILI